MAKPEQFTIQQVVKREEWKGDGDQMMVTYELLFPDDSEKKKSYVPLDKDPHLEDGQTVEGWMNPGGKFGIATGSSNGGQRRSAGSSAPVSDDDTRRSIERQVAFKEAMGVLAPFYEGMNEEVFGKAVRQLTDMGHGAIRGE